MHAKNQIGLTYFTGQNRPQKKWACIGIFKPAEPHSPLVACCYALLKSLILNKLAKGVGKMFCFKLIFEHCVYIWWQFVDISKLLIS